MIAYRDPYTLNLLCKHMLFQTSGTSVCSLSLLCEPLQFFDLKVVLTLV